MKAADIVYTKLKNAAAVAAIVSDRVYPLEVPLDGDLPAVYFEVALEPAVEGSAPMSGAQIQVGCMAHTEASVNTLASAVHTALNGLTYNSGGTWLRSVHQLGRTESRDAENNIWGVLLAYGASVTF
jgi:hypothetical protein